MFKNFIAGEWVTASNAITNVNPSDTGEVVGEYARGDAAQAQAAIDAAAKAFPGWAAAGVQARSNVLRETGNGILERSAELGNLLAREEGKTLPEAIGEVTRAAQIFLFFAQEALNPGGENVPSVRPGIDVMTAREPIGVIGMITPWNFPIAIPAWKIAPALAFGNTVVIKPAELVPGSVTALVEIMEQAGLPKGVLNMVNGAGREVGEAITGSPLVRAVSFTGSQAVGRSIAAKAVADGKKVQLEMGGKNPLVVLDDADLSTAVEVAVNGAYFSTGQRCTASSRLVVTAGIHDAFVDRLADRVKGLTVGHALDKGTDIGPAVSADQLEQDLKYVAIGRDEGAELVCGGEKVEARTPGHYISPALFVGTRPDMRINREEIFGPVASVVQVADYDEALAVANDTEFGLSSGICTASLKHASHFRKNAQAGMVMVNLPTAGVDYHVPFGGIKGSSYGPREQGTYAREFYTQVKTAYVFAP